MSLRVFFSDIPTPCSSAPHDQPLSFQKTQEWCLWVFQELPLPLLLPWGLHITSLYQIGAPALLSLQVTAPAFLSRQVSCRQPEQAEEPVQQNHWGQDEGGAQVPWVTLWGNITNW